MRVDDTRISGPGFSAPQGGNINDDVDSLIRLLRDNIDKRDPEFSKKLNAAFDQIDKDRDGLNDDQYYRLQNLRGFLSYRQDDKYSESDLDCGLGFMEALKEFIKPGTSWSADKFEALNQTKFMEHLLDSCTKALDNGKIDGEDGTKALQDLCWRASFNLSHIKNLTPDQKDFAKKIDDMADALHKYNSSDWHNKSDEIRAQIKEQQELLKKLEDSLVSG